VNDTIQRKEDMHEATNAASEPGFIDGGGACVERLLEEECNKLFPRRVTSDWHEMFLV
jgi:hypothetical protein